MGGTYGGDPEPPPYGTPEPSYTSYSPYGAPPSGGAHGPTRPIDGVSIAGFVLSLLCCAPVGLVLGIVGLGRTKDDRRGGRWAAIAAVVMGGLGTVGAIAFAVFVVWFDANTVSVDSADPGQCVDVDGGDTLWEKSCTEPHDAEVAYQGELDDDLISSLDEQRPEDFCLELLTGDYAELLASDDYDAGVAVDSFEEDDPESGDAFVCYLESDNGSKLDEKLVD